MPSELERFLMRPLSVIIPDSIGERILGFRSKDLAKMLTGDVTNEFLKLLLEGMNLSFILSKDYRKNIRYWDGEDRRDFNGRYLFNTVDGQIHTYVTFEGGKMKIQDKDSSNYHVKVTFKDARALRGFLLSGSLDILDAVLENKIDLDGNLTYIYKFGFMATDLLHRLNLLDLVDQ